MKPLVLPQVNMNGSSRKSLVQQQCDVMRALRATYKAMAEATPHGRDYQFQPAEYPTARDAWLERMRAVSSLLEEIEAHAMAIDDHMI